MRRLVPEIVQTSAMDCGPAALAAMLNGSGIAVSYPRLRELCQTDVDGTSIDTLEELACELGLDAEQVMLPNDCLFDAGDAVLPCLAVVRLPNGLTHFVVAWREQFGLVQVMDPATGRRWMSRRQFLDSLYQHAMPVPAEDWLAYACTEEFAAGLRRRLERHLPASRARALTDGALAEQSWRAVADIDALARLAGVLRDGGAPRADVTALFADFERDPAAFRAAIPERYYQVTATDEPDQLLLRGSVLLKLNGGAEPEARAAAAVPAQLARPRRGLLAELKTTLESVELGNAVPALLLTGFVVGLLTLIEGLLFRYLLDVDPVADPLLLGLLACLVLVPLSAGVLLDRGAYGFAFRLGRQIDGLLRTRLLERLPRMRESYFASRLISDLAERGHSIAQLREIPELLVRGAAAVSRLFWLGVGLLVLAPDAFVIVLLMVTTAIALPVLLYPLIAERDLRSRAHLAALGRINLDTLRGAEAIWSHSGRGAVEVEHEALLGSWRRTGLATLQASTFGEAVVTLVLLAMAAALIADHLPPAELSIGSVLLLAFWALSLPLVAAEIFELLRLAPSLRNVTGRVLELFAPDELEDVAEEAAFTGPVSIDYRDAAIARSQLTLLGALNVSIPAGQRVAIVGESGAGKSSLLATLLGFQPVTSGELLVNDRVATPAVLAKLREKTVCIDSELYLWNRSILDNLLYGSRPDSAALDSALADAQVKPDLVRMREGLATRVGENGARLSGGEGQRVRIARGLLSEDPALLLLDEPFRGMDRAQRGELLEAVLARWPGVTTLFVSHDVAETLAFDRVLVIADGTVVEDGEPRALSALPDSRYAALLRAEPAAERARVAAWGQLRLDKGVVEVRRGR